MILQMENHPILIFLGLELIKEERGKRIENRDLKLRLIVEVV